MPKKKKSTPIDRRPAEDRPRSGTTKLTPKAEAVLVNALGLGVTLRAASNAIGCNEETVSGWIRAFPDLLAKVQQEKGKAAILAHQQIADAAEAGTWQASRYRLERLYPEDYSPRSLKINLPPPRDPDAGASTAPTAGITLNLNIPWDASRRIRDDPSALDSLDAFLDDHGGAVSRPADQTNRPADRKKQPGGNGRRMQRG